jgi:hypothetical protein
MLHIVWERVTFDERASFELNHKTNGGRRTRPMPDDV